MSDPIAAPPPPVQTDPLRTGTQTSEFKAVALSQILSIIGTVVPPVWLMLSQVADSYPQVRWIALAASTVFMLWGVLASLGYAKERTALKKAIVAAGKPLAVLALLAGLAFATPAFAAGPGVWCLKGCDNGTVKMVKGVPETQISDVLWVGPGVGVLPFVYNGATHQWTNPVQPAISFGAWYRPANWTATKSLLGASFSMTGDFSGLSHLDPLLTLTLLDNFTVGGGVRVNFATGGQTLGANGLFAVGWQTSFGGP